VAMIKAFVRREGLRLSSGEAEGTAAKLAQLVLPLHTTRQLAPLVALLAPINSGIDGGGRAAPWFQHGECGRGSTPEHAGDRAGDGDRLRCGTRRCRAISECASSASPGSRAILYFKPSFFPAESSSMDARIRAARVSGRLAV
jgi:hypothetical protein